jgi:hypothetical protein
MKNSADFKGFPDGQGDSSSPKRPDAPAGGPLGGVFGAAPLHEPGKPGAGKMPEQLMKQAGYLYH